MKTRLCPVPFEKMVRTMKTFGIVLFLLISMLFLIMFFAGLIWNVGIVLGFALAFMPPILPFIIIGILYERIAGSYAIVMVDKLLIVDSRGNCWREISFDSINAIKIEEIETLNRRINYTMIKVPVKYEYICVYINNQKDSSYIAYRHLLRRKKYNMFPIFFQEEFYAELLSRFNLYSSYKC